MDSLITTHVCDIYALEGDKSHLKHGTSPAYEGVEVAIVPIDPSLTVIDPGNSAGQLHECYVYDPTVVLKPGSKLVNSEDETEYYVVQGQPQRYMTSVMTYTRANVERKDVPA